MLPPSLYADTAEPAAETPPVEGLADADVCVIGAGITGLSAALHLAEAGTRVVVIDAKEPGWGASGRNGGQVNPGLKHDPDKVEKDFGPDLGGRMVALSYGAPDALFELIRRHQIRCEARQEGTLRAAIGTKAAAEAARSAEQGMRRGWPVSFTDAAETAQLTGTKRYTAGMVDARGGDLQPLSYARGLARAAIGQGARVHGGTPALRLARASGSWSVQTPLGEIRAEHVVLATNGYTDDLWPGLRRSLVPAFSSIAASAPIAEDVARAIMPRRTSLYELGRIPVYYRMDQQNRIIIGGRGPQRPIQDTTPIRWITEYAARLWPELRDVAWTHGWNGKLGVTPDFYPHLHEPAPGLIAALGYSGRGVAMATAMGGQVARRLLGTPAEALDMPVTSIKPMPFHAFWRLGVVAKVWEGRVLDRLGL